MTIVTAQRSLLRAMLRALRHPLETVVCGLLIAMTFVVFSQVVARYIFEAPLSWSEELARFLLMWLSMLSAAYAFKTKSHFALRIVVGKLSQSAQWVMALFVHGWSQYFFQFYFIFQLYSSMESMDISLRRYKYQCKSLTHQLLLDAF